MMIKQIFNRPWRHFRSMNKIKALTILIENSLLIPDENKQDLLNKIPEMTNSQINDLGKLLAADKKREIDSFESTIHYLNQKIEQLEKIKH